VQSPPRRIRDPSSVAVFSFSLRALIRRGLCFWLVQGARHTEFEFVCVRGVHGCFGVRFCLRGSSSSSGLCCFVVLLRMLFGLHFSVALRFRFLFRFRGSGFCARCLGDLQVERVVRQRRRVGVVVDVVQRRK
jgi:hypothetical protein